MIDIKLIRENKELVKENIKKKFQDHKLELVDKVLVLDKDKRESLQEMENLRAFRNNKSAEIGKFMREGRKDEAEQIKKELSNIGDKIDSLTNKVENLDKEIRKIMLQIPNIIDDSVPIGKDDSENVEIERFGEPIVPNYEIPYHADIINALNGMDKDAAGRTSGNGFYYLMGDIARLHSAMLSYARDFMINKGFTYCVPPFMIRSDVVNGVMSFDEMDAMMYKIEDEDLYLIGTSEHSMIGKFKGSNCK